MIRLLVVGCSGTRRRCRGTSISICIPVCGLCRIFTPAGRVGLTDSASRSILNIVLAGSWSSCTTRLDSRGRAAARRGGVKRTSGEQATGSARESKEKHRGPSDILAPTPRWRRNHVVGKAALAEALAPYPVVCERAWRITPTTTLHHRRDTSNTLHFRNILTVSKVCKTGH